MLQELLAEPSGLIHDLLNRLGSSISEITTALAGERPPTASHDKHPRISGMLTCQVAAFIPAPIDDVWALLSDPLRMPEWNPGVGSVEAGEVHQQAAPPTTIWAALPVSRKPDGKPLRIKAKYRRRQMDW
ncbi:SRPBCC family protein [Arthrobacter sp. HLT1-21]